jgi:putative DNA primase/helicase
MGAPFCDRKSADKDWPKRAREAALALSGEDIKEDDEIGTALFTDVRVIFDLGSSAVYVTKEDGKQIKSEELVKALVAIEKHPWAEFGRDRKPITQNRLARLLKPYKIKPGTIRIGLGPKDTAKGYKLAQFADAFARYLPAPSNQTVTPSQLNNDGRFAASQSVTLESDVTLSKASQQNNDGHCDGVTDCSPSLWEQEL